MKIKVKDKDSCPFFFNDDHDGEMCSLDGIIPCHQIDEGWDKNDDNCPLNKHQEIVVLRKLNKKKKVMKKKDMVFCEDCENFYDSMSGECYHKKNLKREVTWKRIEERQIEHPKELNKNNNCTRFKLK